MRSSRVVSWMRGVAWDEVFKWWTASSPCSQSTTSVDVARSQYNYTNEMSAVCQIHSAPSLLSSRPAGRPAGRCHGTVHSLSGGTRLVAACSVVGRCIIFVACPATSRAINNGVSINWTLTYGNVKLRRRRAECMAGRPTDRRQEETQRHRNPRCHDWFMSTTLMIRLRRNCPPTTTCHSGVCVPQNYHTPCSWNVLVINLAEISRIDDVFGRPIVLHVAM